MLFYRTTVYRPDDGSVEHAIMYLDDTTGACDLAFAPESSFFTQQALTTKTARGLMHWITWDDDTVIYVHITDKQLIIFRGSDVAKSFDDAFRLCTMY